MPKGLKRRYGQGDLHFLTFSCYRRLTQVTDPTGTYTFTFDNMGRLTAATSNYSFGMTGLRRGACRCCSNDEIASGTGGR